MNTSKKVSIVLCTYNGEKFLGEQLDSIVGQTYPIFELLIQDDRSTDATVEIIKQYAARYSFIHWRINERNVGFNANFRTAIQRAKGELIAISDQDDIWYSNKLEEMVSCIGDRSLCYSFSASAEGQTVVSLEQALNQNNSLERLLFSNCISGHNMLLQKTFVDRIGVWDDTLLYDWWLAVNAHLQNGLSKCGQVLTFHRIHSGSAMRKYHTAKAKAYAPYVEGYSRFKALQEKQSWQFFYQHICQGSKDRRELARANRMARVMLKGGIAAFLSLCFLSMKYKEKVMPRSGMNEFRAFFYPCFYAHQNSCFGNKTVSL